MSKFIKSVVSILVLALLLFFVVMPGIVGRYASSFYGGQLDKVQKSYDVQIQGINDVLKKIGLTRYQVSFQHESRQTASGWFSSSAVHQMTLALKEQDATIGSVKLDIHADIQHGPIWQSRQFAFDALLMNIKPSVSITWPKEDSKTIDQFKQEVAKMIKIESIQTGVSFSGVITTLLSYRSENPEAYDQDKVRVKDIPSYYQYNCLSVVGGDIDLDKYKGLDTTYMNTLPDTLKTSARCTIDFEGNRSWTFRPSNTADQTFTVTGASYGVDSWIDTNYQNMMIGTRGQIDELKLTHGFSDFTSDGRNSAAYYGPAWILKQTHLGYAIDYTKGISINIGLGSTLQLGEGLGKVVQNGDLSKDKQAAFDRSVSSFHSAIKISNEYMPIFITFDNKLEFRRDQVIWQSLFDELLFVIKKNIKNIPFSGQKLILQDLDDTNEIDRKPIDEKLNKFVQQVFEQFTTGFKLNSKQGSINLDAKFKLDAKKLAELPDNSPILVAAMKAGNTTVTFGVDETLWKATNKTVASMPNEQAAGWILVSKGVERLIQHKIIEQINGRWVIKLNYLDGQLSINGNEKSLGEWQKEISKIIADSTQQ